jgi:hypothetical protein
VVFIDEIESIEDNYSGKKGHFNLKLKGGKDVHLKHDKPEEASKWVVVFQNLIKVYKGKTLLDFEIDRKWKDEVDVRVINMIMEELESRPD